MLHRYEKEGVVWVDLESPTSEEVYAVAQEFKLDPRVTDELLSPTPRPRAERYGQHLYLILHFPVWKHTHQGSPHQEIDFILGKKFLITAHYETVDAIHKFSKLFEVETILKREGIIDSPAIFAALIAKLYHSVEYELEHLHGALQEIERNTFAGKERAMVLELSIISRQCLSFHRALSLHDEILEGLKVLGSDLFGNKMHEYLHAVLQEYVRVTDSLTSRRDELSEIRQTNNSLVSTRQNEIANKLTFLTFIGLPSTLVVGLFGANVVNSPVIGNPADFWIVAFIAFLASFSLFLLVRFNRWL